MDNTSISEGTSFFKIPSFQFSIAVHDPLTPYIIDLEEGEIFKPFKREDMSKNQWNSSIVEMIFYTINIFKYLENPSMIKDAIDFYEKSINSNIEDHDLSIKNRLINEKIKKMSSIESYRKTYRLGVLMDDLSYDPKIDFFKGFFGKLPYGNDFFTIYDNLNLAKNIFNNNYSTKLSDSKKVYLINGKIRNDKFAKAIIDMYGK